MDAYLKLLAEIGLALTAAEEAIDEQAFGQARERLDEVADWLAELRQRWPEMTDGERLVVGKAAGSLRGRLDAARRRVPAASALGVGDPEDDPEQDVDPAAAA